MGMTKYQKALLTLMIIALALATAIGFAFGARTTSQIITVTEYETVDAAPEIIKQPIYETITVQAYEQPRQIFPDMATYLALVDNYTPTVGFSTSMDWQTSCEDYCLHAEDYAASRGWEWRPHVLSPGDYKYLYGKDITIPHMAMMAIIDNAIYVTDLPSKRTVSFFGLTLDK